MSANDTKALIIPHPVKHFSRLDAGRMELSVFSLNSEPQKSSKITKIGLGTAA
jgi:hypothetical protein